MKHINLQACPVLEFTTVCKTGFKMSFKHKRFPPAVLFLLLVLHLHLLPALPMDAAVEGAMEENPFSNSNELESKHEIEVVEKRGDGAAAGAHGGGGGDAAAGAANRRGAGAQIPIYTAGAMNHNRDHRHHNSGTINLVGLTCLALILLASIFQLAV